MKSLRPLRLALLLTPLVKLQALAGASILVEPAPLGDGELRPLVVANSDFGDLSGLTRGDDGRYRGRPAGWCGSESTWAVDSGRGASPPTCNPSELGFLRRKVGARGVSAGTTVVVALEATEGVPGLDDVSVEVREAMGASAAVREAAKRFDVPNIPDVTMGWDPSPRTCQDDEYGSFGYPFTNTISGNTPERSREVLAMTLHRLRADPDRPRL